MSYIFLPEITNIIISFFNSSNTVHFKTIIDFFFCSKKYSLDFFFMKNIHNKNLLEVVLKKITDCPYDSNIEIVKTIIKKNRSKQKLQQSDKSSFKK